MMLSLTGPPCRWSNGRKTQQSSSRYWTLTLPAVKHVRLQKSVQTPSLAFFEDAEHVSSQRLSKRSTSSPHIVGTIHLRAPIDKVATYEWVECILGLLRTWLGVHGPH